LVEIARFLHAVRLLTLTGTGGVGKTRLAIAAAWETKELFPDGVVFVGLAPLGDAALVLPATAQALGLREAEGRTPREVLQALLREKRLLLVLDNFEHVVDAAPEVAALIGGCEGLTVLVTSRAPLRVRGEQDYPVGPLALPASTRSPSARDVLKSPSGRLFTERARAASATFSITDYNAEDVATICWRLAGLPLALELAAAKARFLAPAALLSRLDQALSTSAGRDLPARQRTMRATLAWSHELLSEPEQDLFRRLSVFAGGFTLEAAEAVGAVGGAADGVDAGSVLGLLEGLVGHSLVLAETDGAEARYAMLEPIRQYAVEKLGDSGEAEEARRRHAEHHLALAQLAGPGLKGGPEQATWLRRLEAEHDNLRVALGWFLDHGRVEDIALMGWPLWRFWWLHGHFSEGRRWTEEALARTADPPAAAQAKLLFVAGTLAQGQGDWEAARLIHQESLALFRRMGDEEGALHPLGSASIVALGQKRYEEGFALAEECVNLGLALGDKRPPSVISGFAAAAALTLGDFVRARRLAERGLSLAREIGARDGASVALHTLAAIARTEGDHGRAARFFGEGLTLSAEIRDHTNVALCLEGLAGLDASEGDLARAARLWGASEALLETVEVTAYLNTPDRSLHRGEVAAARERLGERPWERAWAEGRAMNTERAVEYALEKDEGRSTTP
jgi:predicted ATPase